MLKKKKRNKILSRILPMNLPVFSSQDTLKTAKPLLASLQTLNIPYPSAACLC